MMTSGRPAIVIPRPDVTVTPAIERDSTAPSGSVDIVISRDNKAKSYRADGAAVTEIVRDAVQKILGDRASAEWIP